MNIPHHNSYVQDILSQADSAKGALARFDSTSLNSLTQAIQQNDFDRIILTTGMGSSLFASYPVWLQLANAGFPAYWIDCSEPNAPKPSGIPTIR
jgi:fructoselysine-6-P-deglycase FrlB-like protein